MSMFTGREISSKHVMCRIQQNNSFALDQVPLDAAAVMIIIMRISVWRLEQLLLSESC